MRYVVVGGGIAGVSACEAIRKQDAKGEIILVDAEEHPLYSRVLLGPYLVGKISREQIFLKTEAWYQAQRIEWLRGLSVRQLDPVNHHLVLSDEREIPYDKCLIATGCQPRLLGEDLRGVSYLRTLDDADHLLQLLREQGDRAQGLIFGGGFIACEYLKTFEHFKVPTTLLFRGPWFWSRTLDAQSGRMITTHLERKGVRVISSTCVEELIGKNDLGGVKTNQGEFAGTILGIGIGTVPESDWFQKAGGKVQEGICVNAFLETTIPDVSASGDVCEIESARFGRSLVSRTWSQALFQGRVAGANMTGRKETFCEIPALSMSVLGLEVIFLGDTSREHAEKIIVEGDETTGIVQRFLRGGKLVGATLVGRSKDRSTLTQEITG